jgi:hypothetical protein
MFHKIIEQKIFDEILSVLGVKEEAIAISVEYFHL